MYPVRAEKDRDFQYGYNQILSAITAQDVIFNSEFNKSSFLDSIDTFLKLQPADQRPKNVQDLISPKARVLYFPLDLPISKKMREEEIKCEINERKDVMKTSTGPSPSLVHSEEAGKAVGNEVGVKREKEEEQLVDKNDEILHIIWPHRWEHDKNPKSFFDCLGKLKQDGFKFELTVLGESFSEIPEEFINAKQIFKTHIRHWGFAPSKADYWQLLNSGHVVVSTAHHEFFGVAMLEAVSAGCFPLVPDRLVYPELYAQDCIYRTDQQLYKKLRSFCKKPNLTRQILRLPMMVKDTQSNLKKCYSDLFSSSETKTAGPIE